MKDHSILSEEICSDDSSFEVESEISPEDDDLKANLWTKYINSPLNEKIKDFNDRKGTLILKS